MLALVAMGAPIFAIAVYVVLGVTGVQALLAALHAIVVQIVKLVIHNAIQIINI